MKVLRICERTENADKLDYIRNCKELKLAFEKECRICSENDFTFLEIYVSDEALFVANRLIVDRIADIICVSYKYELFKEKIKGSGLSEEDKEILLSAVIAADLEDDKRFVKSKIRFEQECSISGIYFFQMQKLQKKWEEIASYVPDYFTPEELKEFVGYLINEKSGRRVYIDGNEAFDGRYMRLNKTDLLPRAVRNRLVKEALLAGAGEICFLNKTEPDEKACFEKYFGDKILNSSR